MKTSFNGLKVSEDGVYVAYNITPEELECLKRHFGNRVYGKDGNYIIFENAQRRIVLQLFVHEACSLVEFDIRRDLLKLFNSEEISEDNIKKLSKKLKEKKIQLNVAYSWINNAWSIVDYDNFLELLKGFIAEL